MCVCTVLSAWKYLSYANKAHLIWMDEEREREREREGERGGWMTNSFHHHPRGKRRLHAYIRIHTHSTHMHRHTHTHTPSKTLFLFVYMQISKWGWPTEQSIVGGHGKHIMALACNDTLLCVLSENSLCVCVSTVLTAQIVRSVCERSSHVSSS